MGKDFSKSSRLGADNLGGNLGEKLYKVKEVATLIGESDNVVRHWLKDLEAYIPTERSDAGYHLFGQKAVQVLRTIQRLNREQRYSIKQIEHYLATGGDELAPTAQLPDRAVDELAEIKTMMEQQQQFNAALLERLDQQQQYIERALQRRDEQLMSTLRALQEAKTDNTLLGRIRRLFR